MNNEVNNYEKWQGLRQDADSSKETEEDEWRKEEECEDAIVYYNRSVTHPGYGSPLGYGRAMGDL